MLAGSCRTQQDVGSPGKPRRKCPAAALAGQRLLISAKPEGFLQGAKGFLMKDWVGFRLLLSEKLFVSNSKASRAKRFGSWHRHTSGNLQILIHANLFCTKHSSTSPSLKGGKKISSSLWRSCYFSSVTTTATVNDQGKLSSFVLLRS